MYFLRQSSPGPEVGGIGGGPWPFAKKRKKKKHKSPIKENDEGTWVVKTGVNSNKIGLVIQAFFRCVSIRRTFFADEREGCGAELIVEIAGVAVVHAPHGDTVLIVLPVIWLVMIPR